MKMFGILAVRGHSAPQVGGMTLASSRTTLYGPKWFKNNRNQKNLPRFPDIGD
jgi:hypothetical protein